jgi:hypothetical protein
MGLTLKRFQEGRWFDYPEVVGVSFLIRPLPLSVGLSIRSKIRERVATVLKRYDLKIITSLRCRFR